MIHLSKPKHEHDFHLEKEGYGELPKQNILGIPVIWGSIEGCICGAKRIRNEECLKRGGGYGEIDLIPKTKYESIKCDCYFCPGHTVEKQ